uniref:hypothetical protein n=1 Tax=Desulfurobacterium sp. TaxID=2004706 RepID=UPI0026184163
MITVKEFLEEELLDNAVVVGEIKRIPGGYRLYDLREKDVYVDIESDDDLPDGVVKVYIENGEIVQVEPVTDVREIIGESTEEVEEELPEKQDRETEKELTLPLNLSEESEKELPVQTEQDNKVEENISNVEEVLSKDITDLSSELDELSTAIESGNLAEELFEEESSSTDSSITEEDAEFIATKVSKEIAEEIDRKFREISRAVKSLKEHTNSEISILKQEIEPKLSEIGKIQNELMGIKGKISELARAVEYLVSQVEK